MIDKKILGLIERMVAFYIIGEKLNAESTSKLNFPLGYIEKQYELYNLKEDVKVLNKRLERLYRLLVDKFGEVTPEQILQLYKKEKSPTKKLYRNLTLDNFEGLSNYFKCNFPEKTMITTEYFNNRSDNVQCYCTGCDGVCKNAHIPKLKEIPYVQVELDTPKYLNFKSYKVFYNNKWNEIHTPIIRIAIQNYKEAIEYIQEISSKSSIKNITIKHL